MSSPPIDIGNLFGYKIYIQTFNLCSFLPHREHKIASPNCVIIYGSILNNQRITFLPFNTGKYLILLRYKCENQDIE